MTQYTQDIPHILAPAGDEEAFHAAIAAGADGVYLGLKHFSARMQAANFSIKELAGLVELGRRHDCSTYVALNSLIKPDEPVRAGRLINRLARFVNPRGIIVQDLGAVDLARQAGFEGEIHLSTLANLSHPAGLQAAKDLGATRVVVPRELSVDEIKAMAEACPDGLDLEAFVHGALCFCVSGRCWWSSLLGGKSGLRGRCVQPCRRVYQQKSRRERFFSCQDLSLDVLVKALLAVPRVKAWKIEGRKKGAHYTFYTVSAYKLLRDNPDDPRAKKEALDILSQSLGRPATHFSFLPQRPYPAVPKEKPVHTGSGLLVGKTAKTPEGKVFFKPFFPLLARDVLRVGYQDDPWHATLRVNKPVPKGGRFDFGGGPKNKKGGKPTRPRKGPPSGSPVFLVDRREPELARRIKTLQGELASLVKQANSKEIMSSSFSPTLPSPAKGDERTLAMTVLPSPPQGKEGRGMGRLGLWLGRKTLQSLSKTMYERIWWWLPPVIWPDDEKNWRTMINQAARDGAKHFVCNAPWQISLFNRPDKIRATAGPFCNMANPLALEALRSLGFVRAIVSPELSREDFLALPGMSPLPLGVIISGWWPVGISRNQPGSAQAGIPLAAPKGELFWYRKYAGNTWIYPNWPLDLTAKRQELEQAGYTLFVHLEEHRPQALPEPKRTSVFNWDLQLL